MRYDTSMIPEILNDYNVYDGDGDKVIGVTNDMTMADIASKVIEMEGAGLDAIEVVAVGLYGAITQEIPTATPYTQLMKYLDTTKNVTLNVRGAIQAEDKGTGENKNIGFRYLVMGKVKQLSPGNTKRGEAFGTKISVAVRRLLIEIGGENVLEIDKMNRKVVVNGVDITEKIRKLC